MIKTGELKDSFMKMFLVSLIAIASCFAQEAKVIQLSKEDATRVKATYEALQKAQADWEAIKRKIADTYTTANGETRSVTIVEGREYKSDWVKFEFSEDFKFIVPKRSSTTGPIYWGNTPLPITTCGSSTGAPVSCLGSGAIGTNSTGSATTITAQ